MRRLALVIILLSTMLLAGCANILIAENTVLSIENDAQPKTAHVETLKTEQPGRVCALSYDHAAILSIGHVNDTYTIDQFDLKTSTLVNVTTSDSRIYDVQAAKLGFFYTKTNVSSSNNIQIVWSSSDRLVERTITDTIDNPEKAIYVYGENRIAYINNSTELVLSDSNGIKNRYALNGLNLEVSKIVWFPVQNLGFLIAQEPDSNTYQLYRIELKDEGVMINTIAKNVLDMDIDDTESKLVYAIQEDNNTKVYVIEGGDLSSSSRLFSTDTMGKLSFNFNAQEIYFTKPLEDGVRATIWMYDIDQNESIQLSSPMRLNSGIFAPSDKNEVYFSENQLNYVSNSELTQPFSYITKLVYGRET